MTASRINKLISLFEKLSTPCPSFPSPGEREKYLQKQRLVLCEIAKNQDLDVVRDYLIRVDAGSERFDSTIWHTLQRAIDLAPLWLIQLKAYAKRDKEQVPDVSIGDPRFDKWAEGAHLNGAQEWETNVRRHSRKYGVDFRGYIVERN